MSVFQIARGAPEWGFPGFFFPPRVVPLLTSPAITRSPAWVAWATTQTLDWTETIICPMPSWRMP